MDFAKNLLGKYGWKEGDGLGRDKTGITKPLKANYKFDNAGLGHNPADDMNNHWWENVYNKAATNLNVATNESNDVLVGLNSKESVEISTKNYSVKSFGNQKKSDYGGSFLKSATLTNEGHEVELTNKQSISPLILKIVSDEDLFKACGGRTAHKGARHGLKLSGKLSRIQEQERELISKIESAREDCSQVFKEYADCKSRNNKNKLKRLSKEKRRKQRKSEKEASLEQFTLPSTITSNTLIEDEVMEEEEEVEKVEEPEHKVGKKQKTKFSNGKVDKREKRKKEKKLKKLAKQYHVSDSKESFLKKMVIEELPISFTSKKSENSDGDVSLSSYRVKDEQSQSDNDNEVQKNILNQLSETLVNVKKKKQKVIVENLTEFQLEHLRNAHVPFVEIKESSRKKSKKSAAKFNRLASNLVNKMSIL